MPEKDYRWMHTEAPQSPRSKIPFRVRATLHFVLAATALALAFSAHELESRSSSPEPITPPPRYTAALAFLPIPGEPVLALDGVDVPHPFTLRRGQTLGQVMGELGLAPPEAYRAVEAIGEYVELRRIRAGESGVAFFDAGEQLTRLELELSGKGRVEIVRAQAGWQSAWREAVRTVEVRHAAGELDGGFLMQALADAGADPAVAYAMSNVLQWDLDFNRDLRRGDHFAVLYEEVLLDGQPAGPGRVLALQYENRGELYEAYLWGEDDAYFDADGQPRRKMFLRSPLPFSRVTSRFSQRRFHPVLKVNRPHYGVDYGAPTGTPARVTANGTVTFKGYAKGAGNMVKVRHANGYLSAYLHLSRFPEGLHVGRRVRQGDVIGFVGATGLATAPHLDYRIQKNDRWIDPLGLPNEPAEPVPAAELPSFRAHRDALRARLGGAEEDGQAADV